MAAQLTAEEHHDGKKQTYISGSFCVSITAATGIPKFEAGPQKSKRSNKPSAIAFRSPRYKNHSIPLNNPLAVLSPQLLSVPPGLISADFNKHSGTGGIRTGREEVIQNLVGTDLRIQCLDRSRHCDRGIKYLEEERSGERRRRFAGIDTQAPLTGISELTGAGHVPSLCGVHERLQRLRVKWKRGRKDYYNFTVSINVSSSITCGGPGEVGRPFRFFSGSISPSARAATPLPGRISVCSTCSWNGRLNISISFLFPAFQTTVFNSRSEIECSHVILPPTTKSPAESRRRESSSLAWRLEAWRGLESTRYS